MSNQPNEPDHAMSTVNGADVLRRWAIQNVVHPFPTARTKHDLSIVTGMTIAQVIDWFKNYRRRQWIADKLAYLLEDTVDDIPTGGS